VRLQRRPRRVSARWQTTFAEAIDSVNHLQEAHDEVVALAETHLLPPPESAQ
jgi:hypothetical protein